jgi:hypothetical protein
MVHLLWELCFIAKLNEHEKEVNLKLILDDKSIYDTVEIAKDCTCFGIARGS